MDDMFTELTIRDRSNETYFLRYKHKSENWKVAEGDIVRIRSVKKQPEASKLLMITNKTNIMKFVRGSKVIKQFSDAKGEFDDVLKTVLNEKENEILSKPQFVSKVDKEYESHEITTLFNLVHKQAEV